MNTKFFTQILALLAATLANVVSETKRAAIQAYNDATGRVMEASLAFDQAVSSEVDENGDSASTKVAAASIDLISELVPGNVDADKKARLKDIARRIVDLPNDEAEEKLENLIDTLIEAKDAGYEMVTALNAPDETGGGTGTGEEGEGEG